MTNDDQRITLDTITSIIDNDSDQLFFVDGPGGTGKTFIENLLLIRVRSQGHIALTVISSGITVILLDDDRTSHSRFRIPIDISSESIYSISAQSDITKLIRMIKLIIWDEAPVQYRHCFETVNRTLRDIRKDDRWFGGIITMFAGEISSLLPC
jgi:ATP-dependent DNA helicase PIF1